MRDIRDDADRALFIIQRLRGAGVSVVGIQVSVHEVPRIQVESRNDFDLASIEMCLGGKKAVAGVYQTIVYVRGDGFEIYGPMK